MFLNYREKNVAFREVLQKIQQRNECQSLPLQSFLALPFQRMTRLPLLMKSVMEQLDSNSENQNFHRARDAYEAGKRVKRDKWATGIFLLLTLLNAEGLHKLSECNYTPTVHLPFIFLMLF